MRVTLFSPTLWKPGGFIAGGKVLPYPLWGCFTPLLMALTVSACSSTSSLLPNKNTANASPPTLTPVNKQTKQTAQTTPPKQHALLNIPLQCRKNVLTPAIFKTTEHTLRTFEGSPAYTNIPATIEWHNTRFQTAPARFPHETLPATYREVTEKITTLRRRIEVVGQPASYKTINKPVTTQEAYTAWKPGCTATDPMQCIVHIPAKKQVIRQQFIDIPASVMQVARPETTIELKRSDSEPSFPLCLTFVLGTV